MHLIEDLLEELSVLQSHIKDINDKYDLLCIEKTDELDDLESNRTFELDTTNQRIRIIQNMAKQLRGGQSQL